jgi:hypothetical protein
VSRLACLETYGIIFLRSAGVVQLVERLLAKEKVTGSSPVARSSFGNNVNKRKTEMRDFLSLLFFFVSFLMRTYVLRTKSRRTSTPWPPNWYL